LIAALITSIPRPARGVKEDFGGNVGATVLIEGEHLRQEERRSVDPNRLEKLA